MRRSNWYLMGFLVPRRMPARQRGDADGDNDLDVAESAGLADDSVEDRKAAKKGFFPSSLGLSFLVDAEVDSLEVVVRRGDFCRVQAEGDGSDQNRDDRRPGLVATLYAAKLRNMTAVPNPRFYAPPPEPEGWQEMQRGIGPWRFPEWFVVQDSGPPPRSNVRSRRLVHGTALDNGRFEGRPVVATRFVRACRRGHVDDLDWFRFVHGPDDPCRRALWLDERGTSGDLAEQIVRCECGKSRRMHEATDLVTFGSRTSSGAASGRARPARRCTTTLVPWKRTAQAGCSMPRRSSPTRNPSSSPRRT